MAVQKDDSVRVRTNKTYEFEAKGGIAGFTLKFDSKQIAELVEGLQAQDAGFGVTVFMSVYENDSEFNKGETYLSSTFGIIPQEEPEKKNAGAAKGRSNVRSKINKSYSRK